MKIYILQIKNILMNWAGKKYENYLKADSEYCNALLLAIGSFI